MKSWSVRLVNSLRKWRSSKNDAMINELSDADSETCESSTSSDQITPVQLSTKEATTKLVEPVARTKVTKETQAFKEPNPQEKPLTDDEEEKLGVFSPAAKPILTRSKAGNETSSVASKSMVGNELNPQVASPNTVSDADSTDQSREGHSDGALKPLSSKKRRKDIAIEFTGEDRQVRNYRSPTVTTPIVDFPESPEEIPNQVTPTVKVDKEKGNFSTTSSTVQKNQRLHRKGQGSSDSGIVTDRELAELETENLRLRRLLSEKFAAEKNNSK